MNPASRTYKSIKNSIVALSFYAVTFLLSFIARRVLLKYLGPDILGLNTTATSLLGFLNIAELGIGTAIAVTLYKPLQEKNQERINEIVSLQGWFYRRVAWVIIGASCILAAFFPLIFKNSGLPIWYAFASYGVLLFSSLLGYFFNYKQIVLSANQQQYLVQFSFSTVQIIKTVAQLVAVSTLSQPYVWWLILEFLFAIISSIVLNFQIKKTFPDLEARTEDGPALRIKYPGIVTKVKQLFVHKISTFALTQTSPLIIYGYADLAMVTSYGNYIVITNGLSSVLNAVFNSMGAGVGNLVAEGDKPRILKVFRELFSSRFLVVATMSYCLYKLSAPFITLWVGAEYVLDKLVVFLIVSLFFIRTQREVVDSYINAYGMFHDIWAPMTEATLNVGLSILLGWFYGLPGILGGVLISQLLIIMVWKPYFLFSRGLHEPIGQYVWLFLKHLLILSATILAVSAVMSLVKMNPSANMWSFIGYAIVTVSLTLGLMGLLLLALEQGMRDFAKRLLSMANISFTS